MPILTFQNVYFGIYPTALSYGLWSNMVYASKGIDPLSQEVKDRVAKGMQTFGQHLRYYNMGDSYCSICFARNCEGYYFLTNFPLHVTQNVYLYRLYLLTVLPTN